MLLRQEWSYSAMGSRQSMMWRGIPVAPVLLTRSDAALPATLVSKAMRARKARSEK